MAWLWYILMLIVSIFGLLINILGLPGLWVLVASVAGYAWLTGWNHFVGWPTMISLIVLGLIAETLEFMAGAAGSKAAGGRMRGMIGAVVGAMIGGIFLSILPIPVVSTIFGACLGAFFGAAIMELTDKDFRHSLRVGVGAAKGRLMGIVIKSGIGIIMLVVVIIFALPI
jgi:uncharacterized protein